MIDSAFAQQVQEYYPEGLTGVLSLGGTRTTYILETNRQATDPGKIDSFEAYVSHAFERAMNISKMFLDIGTSNLIVNMFWYLGFTERGDKYAQQAVKMCLTAIDDERLEFYKANNVDPYFVGLDTLLHLPEDHIGYGLGQAFLEFQNSWDYQPNRRKLIWEVVAIPLFSIWNAHTVMGEAEHAQLDQMIEGESDLKNIHDRLYQYYSKALYGLDIPIPHFYLGSNRNGDIKLRANYPIALLCGEPTRFFYTPYPSLFIKADTVKQIIYDLMHGKRLRSEKLDYTGQMTPELATAEYNRILALSDDKYSTVGLTRGIE